MVNAYTMHIHILKCLSVHGVCIHTHACTHHAHLYTLQLCLFIFVSVCKCHAHTFTMCIRVYGIMHSSKCTHTLSVCAWCILVYVCIHHSHIIYTYMHIYSWCACSCMCIVYSVCVAQSNWRKGGQLKGKQIEESSNDARCMTSFVRYAYITDKNDSEGEINWGSSIVC